MYTYIYMYIYMFTERRRKKKKKKGKNGRKTCSEKEERIYAVSSPYSPQNSCAFVAWGEAIAGEYDTVIYRSLPAK